MPVSGIVFSWIREDNYIAQLRKDIFGSDWVVEKDNTEADKEVIREQADIIVCAPGLRW